MRSTLRRWRRRFVNHLEGSARCGSVGARRGIAYGRALACDFIGEAPGVRSPVHERGDHARGRLQSAAADGGPIA